MKSNFFGSSSILKNFLIYNFIIFLLLGIFTYLYLKAIKPELVKDRSNQHINIIHNTSDHINRLNVEFDKESMTNFLLSTRFLFQNLDRVQLYDLDNKLLADTDTLDLVQDIFIKNQNVQEASIDDSYQDLDKSNNLKSIQAITFNTENYVKIYSKGKKDGEELVIGEKINNNFYVITVNSVKLKNADKGYIVVSEIANDILFAVKERKNFILRTVLSVAAVILIFSVFS